MPDASGPRGMDSADMHARASVACETIPTCMLGDMAWPLHEHLEGEGQ